MHSKVERKKGNSESNGDYWSQKALSAHENAFQKALDSGVIQHDVVLVMQSYGRKKEIRAVKALLASISPVFKNELISKVTKRSCSIRRKVNGMEHIVNTAAPLDQLSIPSIFKFSALEGIVRYSFGVDPHIDKKNVYSLRKISKYYSIESLLVVLDQYIEQEISSAEKFCKAFHFVCETDDSNLIEKCLTKFQRDLNHRKVFFSKGFLCLKLDPDIRLLLGVESLKVESEDVWERCKAWANSQSTYTLSEALQLIKQFVKFELMRPEYLMTKVYHEHVLDNEEYVDALSLSVCNVLSMAAKTSDNEGTYGRFLSHLHGGGIDCINDVEDVGNAEEKVDKDDARYFLQYLSDASKTEQTELFGIGCRSSRSCYNACLKFVITEETDENEEETPSFLLSAMRKIFCLLEGSANIDQEISVRTVQFG